MTTDPKTLRKRCFDLLHRLRETDFFLGATQLLDQFLGSADRLTDFDDLVKDFVLMVLDHAPVVRERSDPVALVLALAAFEKVLAVLSEEAEHLVRDGDRRRGGARRTCRRLLRPRPF